MKTTEEEVDKPWSGRFGSLTSAHWVEGLDVNG